MVLVLGILSGPGLAQNLDDSTRGSVRDMAREGLAKYDAGQYQEALDALSRAYAVMQVPSLGLWSARALEKLGKLVEASERYLETSRLPLGNGDTKAQ